MAAPLTDIDLHIHTYHSYCASADMTLKMIAQRAGDKGLVVAGISDHLWLDLERGCRPAVDHILETRLEIEALHSPVLFLLGAEADCAPGRGAAGGDELRLLDYAVGSYHFADVRENQAPVPENPEQLGKMLADGFLSVVSVPHIKVAGHPLHIPRRIYRAMPDALFDVLPDAYRLAIGLVAPHLAIAASRGVAIEINSHALFPRIRGAMLPFFRLAREAGCRFAITSDAHRPGEIGRGRAETMEYARLAGISSDDLLDAGSIARRAGQ